jgi:hypothetical protein
LRKGQVAKFVEDDEALAAEVVGQTALPSGSAFGLELVDQIDDIEEPATGAVADAGASDRDGEMRLAGAGSADQHDVALVREEVAACEVADKRLVDRRVVEAEVVDVLGQRQLGDGDLVSDGSGLLFGDLRPAALFLLATSSGQRAVSLQIPARSPPPSLNRRSLLGLQFN